MIIMHGFGLSTVLTQSHDIPNSLLTELAEEPYEQIRHKKMQL